MRKQQSGFTLIELVMVIVILGILAATALPKFYDFSAQAETATVKGLNGAFNSTAAINYANNAVTGAGALITDDVTLASHMSQAPAECAMTTANVAFTCTVNGTGYTFTVTPETAAAAAVVTCSIGGAACF